MDPNVRQLVRLNLTQRIAARGLKRLREAFGSLGRAFAAPEETLARVRGIGAETAKALRATSEAQVEEELGRAEAIGARVVALGGEGYPERLSEIVDPPLVLYVRGELKAVPEPAAAIVGARRATPYGLRMAGEIGRGLAEAAVAVVSGLARGVDAAAHRAAIEAGGRTIAVLGSGIDRPYPPEHDGLVEDIVRLGGAVLSEFPLGVPPLPFHFPRRNRVVSGLALGVVIVEAADRSGSLITAEWALEQGREVMAVPGRAGDRGSAGCHRLIQDGAALVEDADDVIATLGLGPGRPSPSGGRHEPPEAAMSWGGDRRKSRDEGAPAEAGAGRSATTHLGLSPLEERVYATLSSEPCHIDEVIETSGLPASTVFGTLTALELRRAVKAWPGKLYQRV